MKIQILRGSRGEILAAFERRPGALVSLEAEVEEGQELEEVEVPAEYIGMPARDFMKRLQEEFKR